MLGIAEAGDAGFEHATQGQTVLVGDVIDGVAVAILSAVDVKGMEMAALPTHRRLDRLMQRAERHCAGHEELFDGAGLPAHSMTGATIKSRSMRSSGLCCS